ncbi:MAG: hypothetical protein BroJett020_19120 [Bacteroidota bacterium]|nr:MAG: hypothetical protein BroJett020_19120 [Bacteroidota bacterium]
MDKMKKIALTIASSFILFSCAEMEGVMKEMGSGETPLTNEEVIKGLKQALEVGTNNSVKLASKPEEGFYKNARLFIPFPPEAIKVKNKVEELGMQKQVEKFVLTLNRAAEEAALEAAPIFVNAITQMSIADGFAILKGNDNAATMYLKDKTTNDLIKVFRPVVERAINKVELTKAWDPIVSTYNKIPLVEKVNPDLAEYITGKAVAGMFILIEDEERLIRKDPMARVTDLLKRVFGSKEAQK